ncbi:MULTISPECIES: homocysteine S-methyltransferase [Streptococcus]|uniref:S-methylmethionine:homocysteine methyltransferase n=1 Tax=Streptococcus thermophilus TaxID=1308 RepID=A0A8D6XQK4_STRTR|nr:homocysteine S-methyltransferase [Streptococcus thermophilus]EWM62289.1 homocysteine methyltransferase [Streptococcus thermophilus TH1477]MCA6638763.1 homocysteine S-methyltransferase [Streptococcus thermophilus]MCA6641924.1 homocysteine S-methyltransferase [Streptococcus thermophilus]MCA6645644.1 homocysteine S-methyltransferase [Streptococcus thermophilus]PJH79111.1 homocysteine S-methyltransferase [Streptococcus thermophilus]
MATFKDYLENNYPLILHGALGTEMEALGYDISGKLWSAKYLLEKSEVIQELHETYVAAGADLITTSSYQATLPGLVEAGLTEKAAEQIIALTVRLAKAARDKVWGALNETEKAKRPYPLISGDVGPYAAYLANGSEYSGDYGEITINELKDFHRPRIQILLDQGVDLLALETIPNRLETQALIELLAEEFPEAEAYMSFTVQIPDAISDGNSLAEMAKLVSQSNQILAVGINCSSPLLYNQALSFLKNTGKALITYPNSGEVYDGDSQTWKSKDKDALTLVEHSKYWHAHFGVKILGGCCRTRPNDIKALYQEFRT